MSTPFSKHLRNEKARLKRYAKLDPMYTGYSKAHIEAEWFKSENKDVKRINETIESIDRRWDLIEQSTDQKPDNETGKDETK